jgi:hypothetical protein
MRLRWVDDAMTNGSVDMVLQQFWVYDLAGLAGEWVDIPDAGHVTKAPKNTLQ